MKYNIAITHTSDNFGQKIYQAENIKCGGYKVWAWTLKGLEKKLDKLARAGVKITKQGKQLKPKIPKGHPHGGAVPRSVIYTIMLSDNARKIVYYISQIDLLYNRIDGNMDILKGGKTPTE